jgi:hypothetical protein
VYHPGIALHPGLDAATDVLGSGSVERLDAASAERAGDVLLFQRCNWCATAMYNRLLCHVCGGSDLRTEASAGTGVVRHSTVIHRNTPAARNVSLVEMAEGFTVRGRVMGSPATIHSGDRVQLSTAQDPVRRQPVFQLTDGPYGGWN